ncbi:MAG: metallophosphoesterase [Polyangiales bacterium]
MGCGGTARAFAARCCAGYQDLGGHRVKLYAISDLHVGHRENRALLSELRAAPEDWLILGGDLAERVEDVESVFDAVNPRFARVLWVPGNHELWTVSATDRDGERGEAKYRQLIESCRKRGVLTPEDPYPLWPGEGPPVVLVPMFLLYDYSFRPAEVRREDAIAWAGEHGIRCTDEELLHPDPYSTLDAWCDARVTETTRRLEGIPKDHSTVLINHFPLRKAHARLPAVPRFSLWCGTTQTEDWHLRYRARAVVYGHLHIPRTHIEDGTAFEEVSLGYPRQRAHRRGPWLRQVWPRP